ncbi:MAG TPA: RnfABCDGE type electron transport complex subunit G [Steroidobacteraceae bacterium]|nr:RnfABCDGE type electron transport complex subunit G [Steroidobacteraceae bacterium]
MATNADTPRPNSARDTLLLVAVTAVMAAVVLGFAQLTRSAIENNSNAELMAQIEALLPPGSYDNDLLLDRADMSAPDLLGTPAPIRVLRARRNGQPVAAILLTPGVQGYGGPIYLIVAVDVKGKLLGVQVRSHHETPGIGDAFERTPWLNRFKGRSLMNPSAQGWAVRKDGGEFDQFTGATITPRAIVSMVRRSLEFYASRHDRVFSQPSQP